MQQFYKVRSLSTTEVDGFNIEYSLWDPIKNRYLDILRTLEYVYREEVAGDVAEFGVQFGQESSVISWGMSYCNLKFGELLRRKNFPEKSLRLFDTFDGYPEVDNDVDREQIAQLLGEEGGPGTGTLPDITPDQQAMEAARFARKTLGEERVKTHIGLFSDTLPELPDGQQVAMASIDCNFYQSTTSVLDHLFANRMMSEGGIIFFGGAWNHCKASPNHGYRRAWRECTEKHGVAFSEWGWVGDLGPRFIIHGVG